MKNNNKNIRAAVYVRFSSQRQNDSFSIEYQLQETTKYIELKGYQFIESYVDAAKSGKKTAGRDAFYKMIDDAKRGKFDRIVVFSFSRSFRNTRDALNYNHDLMENYGVVIESVIEPIDFTNPHGKFSGTNLFAMHELQSDIIAAHVRSGMYVAAKHGYFMGGHVPYGYELYGTGEFSRGKERRKYKLHPTESQIIKKAFEMYADGFPLLHVLKTLHADGVTGRDGKKLSKSTLQKILHNPFYTGTRIYNVKDYETLKIENCVPAIIDAATWARVQKRQSEYTGNRPTPRQTKRLYTLTGKIVCGCCGAHLTGTARKSKGHVYEYYRCNSKDKYICKMRNVRRDLLEKYCMQQIRAHILNTDAIKNISVNIAASVNAAPDDLSVTAEKLRKRRDKINGIIENLERDIYENEIPRERGKKMISNYENELSEIEIKLFETETALSDAITPDKVNDYLNDLLALASDADEQIIKLIFEKLIDKIVVTENQIELFLLVSPFGRVVLNDSIGQPHYAQRLTFDRDTLQKHV